LVKLNCSDASGGGAERIIDVSQSGTATFKVLPHGLPPNAQSVTLLVRTPAGELEEHSCTVGGSVTLQGHPGESFALVEMRLGETVLSHAEVVRKEESRG
jgi:hypothetical protein